MVPVLFLLGGVTMAHDGTYEPTTAAGTPPSRAPHQAPFPAGHVEEVAHLAVEKDSGTKGDIVEYTDGIFHDMGY